MFLGVSEVEAEDSRKLRHGGSQCAVSRSLQPDFFYGCSDVTMMIGSFGGRPNYVRFVGKSQIHLFIRF